MKNLLQKITAATTAIALSYAVIGAKSASAATLAYNFVAQADSGPLAGNSYLGSFSYNSAGLTGQGIESTPATAFSFNFFKQYSLSDIAASDKLNLGFNNGILTTWAFFNGNDKNVASGAPDFYVSQEQGLPGFLYGIDGIGVENYDNNGVCPDTLNQCVNWEGHGRVSIQPIPEPSNSPIEALAFLGLGSFLVKKKLSLK